MKRMPVPSKGGPDAQLPADIAESFASTIHGSMSLEEILRGCYLALDSRFPVERVSMMPVRPNEFTVTLYSVEGGAQGPTIRSKIIELEESRLRRCVADPRENVARFADQSEQDKTEHLHLLNPNTKVAIYLPLMLQTSLKGVLVLSLGREEAINTTQTTYLRSISEHLALAIENSDAYCIERRRSRQLRMISEIAKQAVHLGNLEEFLNLASSLVCNEFDYQAVQIWTPGSQPDLVRLRGYAHGTPGRENTPAQAAPLVLASIQHDQVLCNNNTLANPQWAPALEETASQLVVPIRLRGKLIGVLALESRRLNAFPSEDLDIMEAVASLIASAFDHLRVFEHAQQSNEYMQALLESVKDLAILSTDIHGYVITSSAGAKEVFRKRSHEIMGRDLLTLFTNPKFQHELARYMGTPDIPTLEHQRISQPIGGLECFLDVTMQRVYDPGKRPIGFLCIAHDVTENVSLQKKLKDLTLTDELTGLFNQRSFFPTLAREIERARRIHTRLTLCLFDLDSFKKFNDTHGHLLGSQVLKETAELMRSNVRSSMDTCFRYGGDEFIVIMPDTSTSQAEIIAERLRAEVHDHFQGKISMSLGIAECLAGLDAQKLMIKADQAMYVAKQKGGNQVVVAG